MTAATLTLTDFLLARIAEDEAVARAATPGPWEWEAPSSGSWPQSDESLVTAYIPSGQAYPDSILFGWGYDAWGIEGEDEDRAHIARYNPARVLADCEARRRIVGLRTCEEILKHPDDGHCGDPDCETIREIRRILAAVYADHPDYRDEWKV